MSLNLGSFFRFCQTTTNEATSESTTNEPTDVPPSGSYDTTIVGLGEIRGYYDPEFPKVITFDGVPYAAPPIGPLRFMPPVEADDWEGKGHEQFPNTNKRPFYMTAERSA